MFSKLNKWIQRASNRPLSKEEIRELASEINRPILEPLKQPLPPGFKSLRHFTHTDVPERVRQIPWFSNCGAAPSVNLTMPVRSVTGWTEAVKICENDQSEMARLEAQNQLTIWLARNARNDYQRWNDLVRACKSTVISPVVEPALREFCQAHGVDDVIIPAVRWCILGALMENEYLHTGHTSFFFFELLEVYEAGHFPCGWVGEWPQGELYIY